MAESGQTRRRQRWAERENRRRETDYQLRYERWSRIDAVFARWLDMARTFDGYEAAGSVPPDVLRRNERVFGSSGAALVEVNRPTGVFGPAAAHHFSALSEAKGQAAPAATTPPVPSGDPRIKAARRSDSDQYAGNLPRCVPEPGVAFRLARRRRARRRTAPDIDPRFVPQEGLRVCRGGRHGSRVAVPADARPSPLPWRSDRLRAGARGRLGRT